MTGADDVKRLLGRALDPEPPLRLDRDELVARGRVRLRMRRIAAAGAVAASVVAVVVGAAAMSRFGVGDPGGDTTPAATGFRTHTEEAPFPLSTTPTPQPPTSDRHAADLGKALSEAGLIPADLKVVDLTGVGRPVLAFRNVGGTYRLAVDLLDAEGSGNLMIDIGYLPPEFPPIGCPPSKPDGTSCHIVEESGARVAVSTEQGEAGHVSYLVRAARPDGTLLLLQATNAAGGREPAEKATSRRLPPVDLGVLRAIAALPGLSYR